MRKIALLTIAVILVTFLTGCGDDGGGNGNGNSNGNGDTTPPLIADVVVADITRTSVVITWITDEPATSQVEYSKMPFYSSVVQPKRYYPSSPILKIIIKMGVIFQ